MQLKNKIAIGITTFLRDKCLFLCIAQIERYYPQLKIYLVDQGNMSEKKKYLYRHMRKKGHVVYIAPFDSGISSCRSILKNMVNEPFMIYIQDDFILHEKSNIHNMLKIMESDPKIGVVGGQVYSTSANTQFNRYEYSIQEIQGKLVYLPCAWLLEHGIIKWHIHNDIKYHYADIVSDFTLWRKEVPDIFDVNVKVIEHSHTYLKLKHNTNWKVAFTPNSSILHSHSRVNKDYNEKRTRRDDIPYVLNYWNIKGEIVYVDRIISKNESYINEQYHIPKLKNICEDMKIMLEQNKPSANIFTKIKIDINKNEVFQIKTKELLKKLIDSNIKFWLLGKTCLSGVILKEINIPDIEIGVYDEDSKSKISEIINNSGIFKYNIAVEPNRMTKTIKLYNVFDINVPVPVINYLEKTFKKSWKELSEIHLP